MVDLSKGDFNDPKHIVYGPGLTRTLYSAGTGFAAGTFYGSCIVAWYPDPAVEPSRGDLFGGKSQLRAVGRTLLRPAMWAALTCGVFTATECMMEAARNETKDTWNSVVAGLAGGSVIGATTGKPNIVIATAMGMGLLMAAVDLSGPTTVYDEAALTVKREGYLPKEHKESEELAALKELYPKFKDL